MNHHQDNSKIVIKGVPALIILVLVASFFAYRILVTNNAVAPELEERVREVLAAEYTRLLLPDLQKSVDAGDKEQVEKEVERLKSYTKRITFTSLKSRGGGDNLYVRAEILVDGKAPPSGKSIRYFHFYKSLVAGYMYQQDAAAFEYYLPFLN